MIHAKREAADRRAKLEQEELEQDGRALPNAMSILNSRPDTGSTMRSAVPPALPPAMYLVPAPHPYPYAHMAPYPPIPSHTLPGYHAYGPPHAGVPPHAPPPPYRVAAPYPRPPSKAHATHNQPYSRLPPPRPDVDSKAPVQTKWVYEQREQGPEA